jgi:hypothetical protein
LENTVLTRSGVKGWASPVKNRYKQPPASATAAATMAQHNTTVYVLRSLCLVLSVILIPPCVFSHYSTRTGKSKENKKRTALSFGQRSL